MRTVLFLTDGHLANDREVLSITGALDPACRLYVLGIGMAPSDALLSRLARMGGGTYAAIDGRQDIEQEFAHLESTLSGPIAFGVREAGISDADPPTTDLFAAQGATLLLDGHRDTVRVTSLDGSFSAECTVHPSPMSLGAVWARQRVQRLEDRRISHPRECTEIDAEIRRLGIQHQIQTRLTSFVAVDENSTVVGEAIEITQPAPEPADRRDVLACPAPPPSSVGPPPAAAMYSPPPAPMHASPREYRVVVGAMAGRDDAQSKVDTPAPWLPSDGPWDMLRTACQLAERNDWEAMARGLVWHERWTRLLTDGLPADAGPAKAAAVLLMLLACMPRRLRRLDLPSDLTAHDLTPGGPIWGQCMAILEPLGGTLGWRGLVSGAKQLNVVAAAAGARFALHAQEDAEEAGRRGDRPRTT